MLVMVQCFVQNKDESVSPKPQELHHVANHGKLSRFLKALPRSLLDLYKSILFARHPMNLQYIKLSIQLFHQSRTRQTDTYRPIN